MLKLISENLRAHFHIILERPPQILLSWYCEHFRERNALNQALDASSQRSPPGMIYPMPWNSS